MSYAARNAIALVATLAIHVVAAAAIVAPRAGEDRREEVVAEFDIEEPPPPPEPEPDPPPPPEREPEAEEKAPEPEPERDEPDPPPPPPDPSPPPPGPTGDPAPGWATEPPAASDQPYNLGDAVPAGHARAPAARGKGGRGGGSGSGGGGEPGGTGEPKPVSVSEIKTMPMPIGDTDFIEAKSDYPAEATRLRIEGQVKVRLVVDAEGQVASKRLVTRLGHGLDQLAMRLAGKLRFKPAIDTSDRPVPAVVVWTFTFTLPK